MLHFPAPVRENVPFAQLTTLAVGGPARYFAEVENADVLQQMLAYAQSCALEVFIIGQGSNLLVCDEGFDGLVMRLRDSSLEVLEAHDGEVRVKVAAGHGWDDLVAHSVAEGWAGVECLSGIPGFVGAAPIQNIGAYGQEVSEVIAAVWATEPGSGKARRILKEECGFGYRTSHFKGRWRGRLVVTHVELCLRAGGLGTVRYADLQKRLAMTEAPPGLAELRAHVLEIRRAKSMVYDPGDPNHRSAGSFFVNPVVEVAVADRVRLRAEQMGGSNGSMPSYPVAGERQLKLSAAWLIERSGFARGFEYGRAGLSSNHVLALINRGGARAREVLDLAAHIRHQVESVFGVVLTPEPDMLGFSQPVDELLKIPA